MILDIIAAVVKQFVQFVMQDIFVYQDLLFNLSARQQAIVLLLGAQFAQFVMQDLTVLRAL